MTRLDRTWIIICTAAVTCLLGHHFQPADAVRATSLFFNKQKTSTTTETAATTLATVEDVVEQSTEELPKAVNASTKPTLTGIPQIDYVHDPNLPRELNGFNLSSYPFLNSMPDLEDIDFKCEGLHAGFYASVKFGCQLYHHCLYDVRTDFLCANFTAFDQKTFICHFVSEVDCKNSHKYWHRNDALYEPTTTSSTPRPSTTPTPSTTTAEPAGFDSGPVRGGQRPNRPRGRPYRRRRPQIEYYDDEYDDYYYEEPVPKRRRKQRPRTRRPIQPAYDDDYEDELPKGRGRDDDYDQDRRMERPRQQQQPNRKNEHRRRPQQRPHNTRKAYDEDRAPVAVNERRKVVADIQEERRPVRQQQQQQQRHQQQQQEVEEPVKVQPTGNGGGSSLFASRAPPKIRLPIPINARDKYSFSTAKTQTTSEKSLFDEEDYYDDDYPAAEDERYVRPEHRPTPLTTTSTTTTTTTTTEAPPPPSKPIRGHVYDEPVNYRRKPEIITEEEYYDDDEEYDQANSRYRTGGNAEVAPRNEGRGAVPLPTTSATLPPPARASNYDDNNNGGRGYSRYDDAKGTAPAIGRPAGSRFNFNERPAPIDPQSGGGDAAIKPTAFSFKPKYEFKIASPVQSSKLAPEPTPDSFQQPPRDSLVDYDQDEEDDQQSNYRIAKPAVRVVKRPFLPSRGGGNPYSPRGLQPVGLNARPDVFLVATTTAAAPAATTTTTEAPARQDDNNNNNYYRPKKPQYYDSRSQLEEIYNTDYDVTLNDALNPTLKPFTGPLAAPSSPSVVSFSLPQQQQQQHPSHHQQLSYNNNNHRPFLERNRYVGAVAAASAEHLSAFAAPPPSPMTLHQAKLRPALYMAGNGAFSNRRRDDGHQTQRRRSPFYEY